MSKSDGRIAVNSTCAFTLCALVRGDSSSPRENSFYLKKPYCVWDLIRDTAACKAVTLPLRHSNGPLQYFKFQHINIGIIASIMTQCAR